MAKTINIAINNLMGHLADSKPTMPSYRSLSWHRSTQKMWYEAPVIDEQITERSVKRVQIGRIDLDRLSGKRAKEVVIST